MANLQGQPSKGHCGEEGRGRGRRGEGGGGERERRGRGEGKQVNNMLHLFFLNAHATMHMF